MSRIIPLVVAVLVCPYFAGQAFAQLTPPAGTAGAGLAPMRHPVRSRKSQAAFRSERHRQRGERAAAPLQYPYNHRPSGTSGAGRCRRTAFLSLRITADDQRRCCRARAQNTPSPA